MYSQIKRDTNFAIPGYLLSIAQLWVEGKRKFLVYINKAVIAGACLPMMTLFRSV